MSITHLCCNRKPNCIFKYEYFKPSYKWLAYYECPNCGKRWFEIITEKSDKPKILYDDAAYKMYQTWKKRVNNIQHGTKSKQFFYYGTYSKIGNAYKTFRTNFNDERELLFRQKINVNAP